MCVHVCLCVRTREEEMIKKQMQIYQMKISAIEKNKAEEDRECLVVARLPFI